MDVDVDVVDVDVGGRGGPRGHVLALRPQGTPADVLYKGTITRIIGEDSPSRLDRGREDGLPKGHVIYEGKKGHVLSYEGEPAPPPPRAGRTVGPDFPPPTGSARGAWTDGTPGARYSRELTTCGAGAPGLGSPGTGGPLVSPASGDPARPAWLVLPATDPVRLELGGVGSGSGVPKSRLGARGEPDGTPWGEHVPLRLPPAAGAGQGLVLL